jgi:hypothetical protein
MPALLRSLVILNVIDLICTLILVGYKFTTEANPIMDVLLQKGPLYFAGGKMAVTLICAGLLWVARKSKWGIPAAISMVGVMSATVFVQIFMVSQLPFIK